MSEETNDLAPAQQAPFQFDAAVVENTPPLPQGAVHVSIFRWIWEGLRASIFLRPRIDVRAVPGPWQLLVILVLATIVEIVVDRFSYVDEASLRFDALLGQWGVMLVVLWLAWCMAPARQPEGATRGGRALAWLALQYWAVLPLFILVVAWLGHDARMDDPGRKPWWVDTAIMAFLCIALPLQQLRLARFCFDRWGRSVVFVLVSVTFMVACHIAYDMELWQPVSVDAAGEPAQDDGDEAEEPDDDTEVDGMPSYVLEAHVSGERLEMRDNRLFTAFEKTFA